MGAASLFEAAQNLGKYTLTDKLGEGHLGPVYRGFGQDIDRPVVVRILCEGIKWDDSLEETFVRECRALSNLEHPNIAAILESGKEGQSRYIAMESLGSSTLGKLMAQKSDIPVETKLSIIIQIAEGLGHAHKKGILHRDLGPGKIHFAADGSVKIRDFAVAHLLRKHLPHPAVRWGVPIYLCPEQVQQTECDERSDIFSAGTIFYELITGVHPFHDRDSNKALDNILSDAPIPTFEKFPDAHPGIWEILRNCLAKNPADRYRSADDLAAACRGLLISLAEDTQLILSELYGSLTPLRRAAALPSASPDTLRLLDGIQKLARGEKEAEYGYLDRLMTLLTEHYPVIQAAASAPPKLDSMAPPIPAGAIRQSPAGSIQPESAPIADSTAGASQPPHSVGQASVAQVESGQPGATGEDQAPPAPMSLTGPTSLPAEAQAHSPFAWRYRRIWRPSYRFSLALLSILALSAAGYVILRTDAAASIRKAWNLCTPYPRRIFNSIVPPHRGASSYPEAQNSRQKNSTNPNSQPAGAPLGNGGPDLKDAAGHATESSMARLSAPGGKPASPKQIQKTSHREEDQQKSPSKPKEEEWNRQLTELLAHGKYSEAAGVLALWVSENPGNASAQELNARVQEILRHLKDYAAAMAESRYPDALSALSLAERLNPSDPNFAEWRRHTEARQVAAKAFLTVHRLGAQASLLLDGHPIGKDGEIENESIPIGSHTLAIENGGGLVASNIQEYAEGQHVALVYDLVKQYLRTMTDADRDPLAQRKAMEDVEYFPLEHDHGLFRGSCQGVLSLDSLDVVYRPSSGSHGFRIPFKILKLKAEGKSISLYYISDNSRFQTFKFQDAEAADRFRQKWDELKALLH